ncbi:MAG: DUF2007 domain-containing protein [Pseudomonadales bacterium]
MKTLYEASNTLDAQMLCDWLQQAGVHARIEGSYLQGGVGELQAMGIIRVVVDDADYYAARESLGAWEALQREDSGQGDALRAERVALLGRLFFRRMAWVVLLVSGFFVLAYWLRA